MKIFFSAANNGFYTDEDHGQHIPSDAVNITERERDSLISAQESGGCILTGDSGVPFAFFQAEPTPQEIKRTVWKRIKAERDRRTESGGYKVGKAWFHSDPKSRIQQFSLVLLGENISPSLQWKAMDGPFVDMTPELASEILTASTASDQAIFAAAEAHKVALEKSQDPEDYDFSTGWPVIFGEPSQETPRK